MTKDAYERFADYLKTRGGATDDDGSAKVRGLWLNAFVLCEEVLNLFLMMCVAGKGADAERADLIRISVLGRMTTMQKVELLRDILVANDLPVECARLLQAAVERRNLFAHFRITLDQPRSEVIFDVLATRKKREEHRYLSTEVLDWTREVARVGELLGEHYEDIFGVALPSRRVDES